MKGVSELLVSASSTLHDVLTRSNAARKGIVLVVDDGLRLIGVVTDGDIRRAILARIELSTRVGALLESKGSARPITASDDAPHSELVALVRKTGISQVPLLNAKGQVTRLVALEDLLQEDEIALQAVVMAGGRGTRLHPLTEDMPKPMLPVGDRPLMERIIRQLSDTGIRQVNITTHFQAEKITKHFGDGHQFGVNLTYVAEDRQLGTAGGLALMPASETTLLVINGDIVTDVDFRAMLAFHHEHKAMLTMATRQYEVQVPYGVIESDGVHIRRVVEKPSHRYFVNAGIYLLEPQAHSLIPKDQRFDMTDLIAVLLARELTVVSFPVWEYWRDIGHHDDYIQVQADARNGTLVE